MNSAIRANDIIEALNYSCSKYDPEYFIPFLNRPDVTTEFPTKKAFYIFFKMMIDSISTFSSQPLKIKTQYKEEKGRTLINCEFLDYSNKFSRLSFELINTSDKISIDLLPF